MSEFVNGLADYLAFSGGVGQLISGDLATLPITDTTVQINFRRETPAQVVLVRQSGGEAYPHAQKELQTIQVLVDGATLSGTQTKAREIHNLLHDKIMWTVSGGHKVMWCRATTLPQSIPVLLTGAKTRYYFSVNLQALLDIGQA